MLLPTRISSALVLVLVASTALGFAPRMKVPVLRVALAAAQVSSSSRNLITSSDTRDDDAKVRTGALAVSHVEPPAIVSDEAKLQLAEPENLRLSVRPPNQVGRTGCRVARSGRAT